MLLMIVHLANVYLIRSKCKLEVRDSAYLLYLYYLCHKNLLIQIMGHLGYVAYFDNI